MGLVKWEGAETGSWRRPGDKSLGKESGTHVGYTQFQSRLESQVCRLANFNGGSDGGAMMG